MATLVAWLDTVGMGDVNVVGGKNASLGEMLSSLTDAQVSVPGGFATTADAFRLFLSANELDDRVASILDDVDPEDVVALAQAGKRIRSMIEEASLPEELISEVRQAYSEMSATVPGDMTVAVRSSATAEDLPDASFAGQQETFLNVVGIEAVLDKIKLVFASLYNDRAIAYRAHKGYSDMDVAISVGVQHMVNAGEGASGVMFTIDTESGFDGVVFITSTFGLGELLVQGAIEPDEFYVSKVALTTGHDAILTKQLGGKRRRMAFDPNGGVVTEDVPEDQRRTFSLTDAEVTELARLALAIEDHYGRPMDIEWARDGSDGGLYILQARPETVKGRESGRILERFHRTTVNVEPIVVGRSVGQRIGSGPARVVRNPDEMHKVQAGDVLVADMTDPDWEPVMSRAAAIVTNRGGRTCHAAIIARELGIPAVVGSGDATSVLADDMVVTVSCAEGDSGFVFDGELEYHVSRIELDAMPESPVKMMMNVANPERAFAFSKIPNHGVGLARVEFVINSVIGVHPKALLDIESLTDDLQAEVNERISGYADGRTFFVDKLKEGVATLAAAFHPKPVIVRMSDFKSNEYAHLIGGSLFEPNEENPMIGFRGASRYVSQDFAEAFALECEALRAVRDDMGFTNVDIMIPFVRTVEQAEDVLRALADNGIERGVNGLRLIMMCEVPSNAIQADDFLDLFDGFSIGSNDLTQFTLALDRDSALVADLFDERNPAVKSLISMAIKACKARGKYIGICGQGPSDHTDFALWLAEEGIDSMSINPDTLLETWLAVANDD